MIDAQDCPYTGPYALAGNPMGHKSKGPTAKALKRGLSRAGAPTLPWREFDDHYNQDLEDALDWMDKTYTKARGNNGYGDGRWETIRKLVLAEGPHVGEYALDATAIKLIYDEWWSENNVIPDLGPVVQGGKSVLAHDLTHATGGLDGYPAFDDGYKAGLAVVAPEEVTITKQSSARRRDGSPNGKAFYCTGRSKLKYWFGHVDVAPAVALTFAKGAVICKISSNHEEPHLHVGIDAKDLIGKELEHHINYTHGAPTVGEQLADSLV
jgi:hypothetical protein